MCDSANSIEHLHTLRRVVTRATAANVRSADERAEPRRFLRRHLYTNRSRGPRIAAKGTFRIIALQSGRNQRIRRYYVSRKWVTDLEGKYNRGFLRTKERFIFRSKGETVFSAENKICPRPQKRVPMYSQKRLSPVLVS